MRARNWIRLPNHIDFGLALAEYLESLAAQMCGTEATRADVVAFAAAEVRTRPLGLLTHELRQCAAAELDCPPGPQPD